MLISQLNDGDCRTYLVVSEKTREAVLVDPLLERTPDYLTLLKKGLRSDQVRTDSECHLNNSRVGEMFY